MQNLPIYRFNVGAVPCARPVAITTSLPYTPRAPARGCPYKNGDFVFSISLIAIEDPLKRDFYTDICRLENWDTRTLNKKIQSMLFERTALSRKPDKLIEIELKELREENKLTPDLVFRDPYFLDFLGLKDTYAEKDLEAAILREMEAFILELGVCFCFVARQKRMQIGRRSKMNGYKTI
jgi:predicted nuclease of restriction endonuclease-like (RecB) superfamily